MGKSSKGSLWAGSTCQGSSDPRNSCSKRSSEGS
jgi:hypothetical protein